DEARSVERRRLSAADSRSAEELYQHVVQTDSSFAPGWAGLARVNAIMVHFMYDPSEERRRLSREAAETALRLAPDAAESHHAMAAYWYWGEKEYDRAAAELTEALES